MGVFQTDVFQNNVFQGPHSGTPASYTDAVADALAAGDVLASVLASPSNAASHGFGLGEGTASRLDAAEGSADSLGAGEALSDRLSSLYAASEAFAFGRSTLDRLSAREVLSDALLALESAASRLAVASGAPDGWLLDDRADYVFAHLVLYLEIAVDSLSTGEGQESTVQYPGPVFDGLTTGVRSTGVLSSREAVSDGWLASDVVADLLSVTAEALDALSIAESTADISNAAEPPTIPVPTEVIERAMQTAERLIKKFGRDIDLVVFTDNPSADLQRPWRVEGTAAVVQTVKGVFLTVKKEKGKSKESQSASKRVLVAAYGLTAEPNLKGEIRVGLERWTVEKIEPLRPGGTDILYTITVTQ